MGGVVDRYVQYQAAGDQVCGRTVAGLDVNSYKFGVSPPFFDPSQLILRDDGTAADVEDPESHERAIDRTVALVFDDVQESWHQMLRFALASLLYHKTWLEAHVHPENRFHQTVLFRRNLADLDVAASYVTICYPWDNNNRMNLTGLTPTTDMYNNHRLQMELIQDLPLKLEQLFTRVLDDRSIGGSDFTSITFRQTMTKLFREMIAPLKESLSDLSEQFTELQSARPGTETIKKEAGGKKNEFDWKTLRTFPVNYELSLRLSVLDLWICWHCGEDKTHGKDKTPYTTPAWKTISASDLKKNKSGGRSVKVLVSHMRHLCQLLDDAGSPGDKPTIAELHILFQSEPVQAVFYPIQKTCTGQIQRVE